MRKYVPSDFMVDVTSNDIDEPSNVYVKVEDLPRWIPVSEQLPEESERVLGWRAGWRPGEVWRTSSAEGRIVCGSRLELVQLTLEDGTYSDPGGRQRNDKPCRPPRRGRLHKGTQCVTIRI